MCSAVGPFSRAQDLFQKISPPGGKIPFLTVLSTYRHCLFQRRGGSRKIQKVKNCRRHAGLPGARPAPANLSFKATQPLSKEFKRSQRSSSHFKEKICPPSPLAYGPDTGPQTVDHPRRLSLTHRCALLHTLTLRRCRRLPPPSIVNPSSCTILHDFAHFCTWALNFSHLRAVRSGLWTFNLSYSRPLKLIFLSPHHL